MKRTVNNSPQFHFRPQKGWMNDPNGTVYVNGEYHLFYQHYPEDIVWGPMHWGHAVSRDLLSWEHKPIALYPDELGYIFSGSCVYDADNISGLGTKENPPIIAMYTNHNPKTGEQQQSIAYSTDFVHFTKYEGNPVIANRITSDDYNVDFRDPKIFRNPIKGGFSMVLAAGFKLEFYHSKDLLRWEHTGEFDPSACGFGGICECPDCFPLETEEGTKWILVLSSIPKAGELDKMQEEIVDEDTIQATATGADSTQTYVCKELPTHVMQYFVGEFDGESFYDTECAKQPLFLDYGPDNYAMVSFFDSEKAQDNDWKSKKVESRECFSKAPLMIGWGENWDYAAQTPATDYRGKMTLARSPKLIKTNKGFRLAFEPVPAPNTKKYVLHVGEKLVFRNPDKEKLTIEVTDKEVIVDRSKSGNMDFSTYLQKPEYNVWRAKRFTKGDCPVLVVEDEGYFEIFAEGGLLPFSVMTYGMSKWEE